MLAFAALAVALHPLQPTPPTGRRCVLGLGFGALGLVVPRASDAIANPWDKGEVAGLKAEATCKPKGTCTCNCMPDGFGGFKERTAVVQPVAANALGADDREAAPKAIGNPLPKDGARRSASSAPELTLDELVVNSVRTKEETYGRKLSQAEVAELTAKITRLLGK